MRGMAGLPPLTGPKSPKARAAGSVPAPTTRAMEHETQSPGAQASAVRKLGAQVSLTALGPHEKELQHLGPPFVMLDGV